MFDAKPYNPKAYEGHRGAIKLPCSIRTYFDGFSAESQGYPIEKKLLDLGYVLKRGYDLTAQMKACLYDRPHISEDEFKYALGVQIEYLDKEYMLDNGYDEHITEYDLGELVSILSNLLDDHYVEYSDDTRKLER